MLQLCPWMTVLRLRRQTTRSPASKTDVNKPSVLHHAQPESELTATVGLASPEGNTGGARTETIYRIPAPPTLRSSASNLLRRRPLIRSVSVLNRFDDMAADHLTRARVRA